MWSGNHTTLTTGTVNQKTYAIFICWIHVFQISKVGIDHPVCYFFVIKNESAVSGWERVRTLYQSEAPNLTQPTRGRKKVKNSTRQK